MSGGTLLQMIVASATALVLITGCAQKTAHNDASTTTAIASPTALSQAQTHDVRVYIDPVTGQLRDPTADELAAEAAAQAAKKQAAAANTQSEQPQSREVTMPDGAVEITLDKSSQHPLLACIQKNGDLVMDHDCDSHTGDTRTGATLIAHPSSSGVAR